MIIMPIQQLAVAGTLLLLINLQYAGVHAASFRGGSAELSETEYKKLDVSYSSSLSSAVSAQNDRLPLKGGVPPRHNPKQFRRKLPKPPKDPSPTPPPAPAFACPSTCTCAHDASTSCNSHTDCGTCSKSPYGACTADSDCSGGNNGCVVGTCEETVVTPSPVTPAPVTSAPTPPALSSVTYPPESPHTTPLTNPERGMYTQDSYRASSPERLDASSLLEDRQATGQSVILRLYYLDTFLGGPISQSVLDDVDADFGTMRAAG